LALHKANRFKVHFESGHRLKYNQGLIWMPLAPKLLEKGTPMRLTPMNFRVLAMLAIVFASSIHCCLAQENAADKKADPAAESGPWLSSISWLDDGQLVATKSQGLLLRPAQIVKLTAADPTKLETVGEQETSLWSTLPVGGNKFVVTDYKGGVYLYGDGDAKKFEFESRWIRALAKAPGDTEILAGTEDGKLVVLSLADRKEARRIDAHTAAIFDIAFNTAGDKVATAAGDGTIKVFSWPKLEPVATLSRGKEAVWAVVFSQDGTKLISGGADRRVQLWDLATSKSIMSLQMTSDWITSLVALPGTTSIAASSMNGKVFVVDYKVMLPVNQADIAKSAIWSMVLSPDGNNVAIATRKHGAAIVPIAAWVDAAKKIGESEAAQESSPAP
jgi:WD40 repeat protein